MPKTNIHWVCGVFGKSLRTESKIWSLKAMAHCPVEKLDKEEKNNYNIVW